jgi:trimethylamine--corrinoid protein Co-methyltransferase
VAQLAQHFELPLYSTSGCSDAKDVDVQAGYESAIMNLLVAMSGANYMHDAAGLMESDLTVAYEKLVIDDEILGMCQRVLRGIEVTDESMGLELLDEIGPGGHFLGAKHTKRHMRSEFFVPRVANRDKRDAYSTGDNAWNRAHAVVEQVRGEPASSCLGEELQQRILQRFPEIVR